MIFILYMYNLSFPNLTISNTIMFSSYHKNSEKNKFIELIETPIKNASFNNKSSFGSNFI